MPKTACTALALLLILVAGCQQSQTQTQAQQTQSQIQAQAQQTQPQTPSQPETSAPASTPAAAAHEVTMPNGLKYTDLKVGDGALAESGMKVAVHYTGWLTDGTKFDSSVDRGQPFTFTLGAGQVIRGWDEGVKGMRVGGKRTLVIPPDLGYGANGYPGAIPPNATLKFDVELLGIQ